MTETIYLDHAASTPTDPRVIEAMMPYFNETYGNASGLHKQARGSATALNKSRQTVADILGCTPKEIIFTACGTESDNLAIRGVAWAQRHAGRGHHLITTAIEHNAVRKTIDQLCDKFGFEQTVLAVDEQGLVNPADVAAAIRPDTVLISVMYANNEIGTLQPLAAIGEIAHEHDIPFHTDAVQAAAYQPLNMNALKVDLLAISGHKIYAPKGIGILAMRNNVPFLPPLTGGSHENNRRPGTENVPYIVGIAKALKLVHDHQAEENERQRLLRDRLIEGVLRAIPNSQLTGHATQRLPNNASFAFAGCEADGILMRLDMVDIHAASGSACTTGMPEPSHVLQAIGLPHQLTLSALRLSLGRETTTADVESVIAELPGIIKKLRQFNETMST